MWGDGLGWPMAGEVEGIGPQWVEGLGEGFILYYLFFSLCCQITYNSSR